MFENIKLWLCDTSWYRKRVYKKKMEIFNNADYDALIKASNEIQAYCINELEEKTSAKFGFTKYYHHLPLKSIKESALSKENWDLPDEDIEKIVQRNDVLMKYASAVCYIHLYNADGTYNKTGNTFTKEILPPHIVFPLFDSFTMHWRMGIGETYMDAFIGFIYSLTDKQREAYLEKYPEPEYMSTNMFGYNVMNHQFKKEGE